MQHHTSPSHTSATSAIFCCDALMDPMPERAKGIGVVKTDSVEEEEEEDGDGVVLVPNSALLSLLLVSAGRGTALSARHNVKTMVGRNDLPGV